MATSTKAEAALIEALAQHSKERHDDGDPIAYANEVADCELSSGCEVCVSFAQMISALRRASSL